MLSKQQQTVVINQKLNYKLKYKICFEHKTNNNVGLHLVMK